MKQRQTLELRPPSFEAVAQRAYEIYLSRGCQPGRDKDDWLQAEYEVLQMPIRQIATLSMPPATAGTKKNSARAVQASALVMVVQSALMFGSSAIT